MIYPKSKEKELSLSLFESPTSEYRGAPFHSWNTELSRELLEKQIDCIKEMGFGGYFMHPRVGLATEYLSEDFMSLVGACVEKSRANGMKAYLYDEDRWPSGFAGGLNTKDIENRKKTLFLTLTPYLDDTIVSEKDKKIASSELPASKYNFIASFDVELDSDNKLVSYSRIDIAEDAEEGHKKLFAYLKYDAAKPYFNYQAYCDVMQKSVIESFIDITHNAYKKYFADDFGGVIPAIFTDEPNFESISVLEFSDARKGVALPYTTDFNETFKESCGIDLEDHLPELIWEKADGNISKIRYLYRDHTAERFALAFSDTIGAWCDKNDILMTGHVLGEPDLLTQAMFTGDVMRAYRGFSLPGIDMLCDLRELTTAKQAQSATHQYGREGVMSELYGVTNWKFDFRGHKLQGDWQAALGVTLRVPHLYWASMRGESKRDYPASIGHQSPWYREYRHIEDHFARVNTILTRGRPCVKIGVIHPIESMWIHMGPNDQTKRVRDDIDARFKEITKWLLYGLYDFDFICEALLPSLYRETKSGFSVGEMSYDTVIVPSLETLRGSTLEALEKFRKNGGKVIFLGNIPKYIDAESSSKVADFSKECTVLPWSRNMLFDALYDEKFFDIKTGKGESLEEFVHQIRDDGDKKYLFISHIDIPRCIDFSSIDTLTVEIKGEWTVTEYETLTGKTKKLRASYINGKTVFTWVCGAYDSLMLSLEKGKDISENGFVYKEPSFISAEYPAHRADFALNEPNVLLLDKASYKIGDEDWREEINIIKADEIIRKTLGLPLQNNAMAQPWVEPRNKDPKDIVKLKFVFDSDIEYEGARLGLEAPEFTSLMFNGVDVPVNIDGYYVDEDAIKTVPLPKIKKGENVLFVTLRVGDATPIENYYILGTFGVEQLGSYAKITNMPHELYFDSLTKQKLPFYGGNVKYRVKFIGGGKKTLEISKYRGAVVKVYLDGREKGYIDFPPHRLYLGDLDYREHTLDIEFFGTRINTFGQLHNTDDDIRWVGNRAWRTNGRFWTDEYLLFTQGILTAPRLLTEE